MQQSTKKPPDRRHRWVHPYDRERLGKPESVRGHWWPRRQDWRD